MMEFLLDRLYPRLISTLVLKLEFALDSSWRLAETQAVGAPPSELLIQKVWVGLEIFFISNKFPDDADAAGLRTTFCETLSWQIFGLSWKLKLTINVKMVLPIWVKLCDVSFFFSSPLYFWGARFLSKILTVNWEQKGNLII